MMKNIFKREKKYREFLSVTPTYCSFSPPHIIPLIYSYTLYRLYNFIKRTPHPHVLSPSYRRGTYKMYAQKFKFYAVSLRIRVNRLIMKHHYAKNIICVWLGVVLR